LPIVAPVLEVPLLPLPPPFILVPVSISSGLVRPVPPTDVPIAPFAPVESAGVPAWLASEVVPGVLVEGLVLPPQLLRAKLASSTAASGKREGKWRMETKAEGEKHSCYGVYGNYPFWLVHSRLKYPL
jgi:hypothetical protein